MTPSEIQAEIDSCRDYVFGAGISEDTRDALRGWLRVAQSGDHGAMTTLLCCEMIRSRIREADRMGGVAAAAASAAVAAHAADCEARRGPRCWRDVALDAIGRSPVAVAIVAAAFILRGLLDALSV